MTTNRFDHSTWWGGVGTPAGAWRRVPQAILVICALLLAVPDTIRAESDPAAKAEQLVASFVDEGLSSLLEEGVTPTQQVERFRGLFDRYFAVDAIARWVLGRHARKATDAEKAEYRALFEDLIVYGYVKRFREYSGQIVRIENAVVDNERMSTVFSKVSREGDPQEFNVAWRVVKRGDAVKITDVVIENASLAQTWRSDFSSTIRSNGGKISALLDVLRERVTGLKAEFAEL